MFEDMQHTAGTQESEVRDNGQTVPASRLLPDFTDKDEVRKAFIASEIFNRKY